VPRIQNPLKQSTIKYTKISRQINRHCGVLRHTARGRQLKDRLRSLQPRCFITNIVYCCITAPYWYNNSSDEPKPLSSHVSRTIAWPKIYLLVSESVLEHKML